MGRFLEHARIYYFRNGGDEEVLLGSADLMPRNLDRRVELLFPVTDPTIRESLKNDILDLQVLDNAKNWKLESTGEYKKIKPEKGKKTLDSQAYCLDHKTKSRKKILPS